MKKTKLMAQAEILAGKPLEEALPEMLATLGWEETAKRLGATNGSLCYWLAKLHIEHRYVFIPPGYKLFLLPEDDLGVTQRIV